MKNKLKSKILAVTLSLFVMVAFMPTFAFAEGTTGYQGGGTLGEDGYTYTPATGEPSVTLQVRAQKDETSEYVFNGTVTAYAGLAEAYGYLDNVSNGVSGVDVLVAAHMSKYAANFTKNSRTDYLDNTETGQYAPSMNKMFGITAGYNCMYFIDKTAENVSGIGSTSISNTVKIVDFAIFAGTYGSEGYDCFSYVAAPTTVTRGEEVKVTVTKETYDSSWNLVKQPMKGAKLGWYDPSTNTVTAISNAVTGNDGKTIITIDKAAGSDYYLTAISNTDTAGSKVYAVMNPTKIMVNKPEISSVQVPSLNYNGQNQTPGITVYDNLGKTVPASEYDANIQSGLNVGKYSVSVSAKGSIYSGSIAASYTIGPKAVKIKNPKKGKKKITVKWKAQKSKMPKKRITGYQIAYSPNADMSGASYKTVKGYKKTSKTIKKLAKKTRYYVQVRTYMGGYYSTWSNVKSVTTK